MSTNNEDLVQQIQRVNALMRHSHHVHAKHHRQKDRGHEAHDMHRGRSHEDRRRKDTEAFDDFGARQEKGRRTRHSEAGHHGQNRVLALLMIQDGASQKDLAYLLGIRPQSLSEVLDHLEKSGLIERQRSEQDKRVIHVSLTEAGRERSTKVAEDRKKSATDMLSVLSEEEKDQLATIMDKIASHLEQDISEEKAIQERYDEDIPQKSPIS